MKNNQKLTEFSVQKASGDFVPFDETKIRRSLQRSGADNRVIDLVIQEIRGQVYEDMPTKALYKMAYKMLKRPIAARYSLKQAMLQLGAGLSFRVFFC